MAYADPTDSADALSEKVDGQVLTELQTDGETVFWLRFGDDVDLGAAAAATSKVAKGTAVYEAKTAHADSTQSEARKLLDERGATYESYWIVNTIKVTGDQALLEDLAVLDEVDSVEPDQVIQLEQPTAGTEEPTVDAVEWNIDNINAPQVWNDYGVRGEGIVVANLDTGVDYTHPAVDGAYRGANADGSFTHDYNFFDPSGTCTTDAPCDNNGHGTHTMGTMVGLDGSNVIGVAPNAKWIATKGCASRDCFEDDLIAAGQWIAAPTDANGENPDPSKAPDVVNNSWGGAGDDDWYEEIVQTWRDAGIFPSFSNGNAGEDGCDTSGSPGLYPISYSSGSYDINNEISSFSSRGPGRDGEVKPNIAAPGSNVRSSLPGGSYGSASGTSMAAPHTSAVVALMISAAPALKGDVAAIEAILNSTARDTEDLECGGTLENNNVFGEGRLDALAAVEASPRGDTGSLSGTVTGDGAPLGGATVVVDGPMDRTLTTGADGSWSVPVASIGDYTVSAGKFGYATETVTVTVAAGAATVADIALESVPSGDVTGVVTDGGAQGWPLYAKVTVTGTDVYTYTDPETGAYELTLPNSQQTLHIEAVYPGYDPADVLVDVSNGATADVALTPSMSCTAPGYAYNWDSLTLSQKFESASTPGGWTVVDRGAMPWSFDDPGNRKNLTGGDGGFAIADSDEAGSGTTVDTDLLSPVFDLSTDVDPTLYFNSDLNMLSGDKATVSVTTDGGATWTSLWAYGPNQDRRGPRVETISLAAYAASTTVQLKFTYFGTFDWWWEIDNVQIGTPDCVATDGGIVVGNVLDENTGVPVNGAKVTDTVSGAEATTAATPDDTALADGFYWLFTGATGAHAFEASKSGYLSDTNTVDVPNHGAVGADFVLGAGRIEVSETELTSVVTLGGEWTHDLELTNTGSAPATVEIGETPGDWTMLSLPGAGHVHNDPDVKADVSANPAKDAAAPAASSAAPAAAGSWSAIADYPVDIFDATVSYGDGKVYAVGGTIGTAQTGNAYVYDQVLGSWSAIAPRPVAANQMQSEYIGGKLYAAGGWLAGGTPTAALNIYDPATNTWSTGAANPAARAAAAHATVDGEMYLVGGCTNSDCTMSNTVLSYDPSSNSWSTHANYPIPTAFLSCGGVDGTLVCGGGFNNGSATTASYAYDPAADSWTALPNMPLSLAGSAYGAANDTLVVSGGWLNGAGTTNATVAYDPAAGAWTTLPSNTFPRARTAGACGFFKVGGWQTAWTGTSDAETLSGLDVCGAADVPWLSEDPSTVTVDPGETVTVEVTTSATAAAGVTQPGYYDAALAIKSGTPYGNLRVDVFMTVAPTANMGKLAGTVVGKGCDGLTVGLSGVQVQVKNVSTGQRTDLKTISDGTYAYWLKAGNYQIIASKDGWAADVFVLTLKKGKVNTVNFTLDKIGCASSVTVV